MNKFILSFISILILAVVALLVIPSFISWDKYKDKITSQVKQATGYDLEINGKIQAAFLPTPHVNLYKVKIDSAGVSGPVAFTAEVEQASVSLSLIPLLSGEIVVSDITMISPVVDLKEQQVTAVVKDKAETKKTPVLGASDTKSTEVKIDRFYIVGAKISYKPLKGKSMVVEFPKLELSADSLMGPYDYDGQVKYQNFDLSFKGKIGEYSTSTPMPINLNIDGNEYSLNFSGVVDLAKKVAEIQGELNVKTTSLKAMATELKFDELPIKDQSFELAGIISASSNIIKINNGIMNFGGLKSPINLGLDFFTKQKKGSVSLQNIPGGGSVVFDIQPDGQDMVLSGDVVISSISTIVSDWLEIADAKIFENPQVPNSVSGDVKLSLGNNFKLNSSEMKLGPYNLRNILAIYNGGDTPKIDLSIASLNGAKIKAVGGIDIASGIKVSVSHPNAVKFIQIFQPDFKSSPNLQKPFSFSGKISSKDDILNVKSMVSKIGNITANGDLVINNGGAIPSIKADLNFGNLDTKALITGKVSSASTGAASKKTTEKSSASPWTRDAIDTSFMRSINLDLTAKAKQLVHGTWLVSNPIIDIDLKQGVLDINKISGGLFGGTVDLKGKVEAKTAGKPINISANIKTKNVDLAKLMKAATSQNKDRVLGTGSFDIDLKTSGLSSSALIYGLNADGNLKTSKLVVKGIDLGKVTEAISDESLTDLAAVVQGAFKNGQTPFEPIDYAFSIIEGTMPIKDFVLVSPTAKLIANGEVSFSRWNMNVKNIIDFTNPDDLPSVEMTIKGPLDSPKQNVGTDILKSFIMNKYGAKIQKKLNKVLGDKLKDTPAASIINNLLGLPQPTTTTTGKTAPVANDNPKPSLEKELLKGLFGKF